MYYRLHWLCLVALFSSFVFAAPGLALEKEAKPSAEAEEASAPKGRLPNHFADVVTPEQREKIYKIQRTYAEKLDELASEIRDLIAKREADIQAVLTAEQREKVSQAKEAIAKKRKKDAGQNDAKSAESKDSKSDKKPEEKKETKKKE